MSESFTIETITPENYKNASFTPAQVADFLYKHLEQFGDPKEQIIECLNYALGITEHRRGFVLTASKPAVNIEEHDSGDLHTDDIQPGEILGTVVVCETGMSGYVPENLLVYIAVDSNLRGSGIGKALMEKAVRTARGDIALHVESDNPARRLYERIGFTNKYLEMRYRK